MDRDYVNSPGMPTAELTGPMALTRHLNACPHYLREAKIVNLTDVYSFDYAEVRKFHSRESLAKHRKYSRAPGAFLDARVDPSEKAQLEVAVRWSQGSSDLVAASIALLSALLYRQDPAVQIDA
jgi:hypothetical protein